jgi:hypothetical protein
VMRHSVPALTAARQNAAPQSGLLSKPVPSAARGRGRFTPQSRRHGRWSWLPRWAMSRQPPASPLPSAPAIGVTLWLPAKRTEVPRGMNGLAHSIGASLALLRASPFSGRTAMFYRSPITAIALAALSLSIGGAAASDESKYPDWSGQWSWVRGGGPPRHDMTKYENKRHPSSRNIRPGTRPA